MSQLELPDKLPCTPAEKRKRTCQKAAERRRVLQGTKAMSEPETLEKMSGAYLELLNDLRQMPEKEFMREIPDLLRRYQHDHSFFIYLMAIEARKPKDDNLVEKSESPQALYKEIIDSFVLDGLAFSKKVNNSKRLSKADLIKALRLNYGSYFKQQVLPMMEGKNLENYETDELLALYQFCMLEEYVRAIGITYDNSDTSGFFTALLPHDDTLKRLGVARTADCNTTALLYAALIAFSNSELLKRAVGYSVFTDHGQIHFKYKSIEFAKNTSYVNVTDLDGSGKNPYSLFPYEHNFYNPDYTFRAYGVTAESTRRSSAELAASLLSELIPRDTALFKTPVSMLEKYLEHTKTALLIDPDNPSTLKTYQTLLYHLRLKGAMSGEKCIKEAERALAKRLNLTFEGNLGLLTNYMSNLLKVYSDAEALERARPYIATLKNNVKQRGKLWQKYWIFPIQAYMDFKKSGVSLIYEDELKLAYLKRCQELLSLMNALNLFDQIERSGLNRYKNLFSDSIWSDANNMLGREFAHIQAWAKRIGWE